MTGWYLAETVGSSQRDIPAGKSLILGKRGFFASCSIAALCQGAEGSIPKFSKNVISSSIF